MSEFSPIPLHRPALTSVFYILVTTLAGFYVVGPLLGFVISIPFIQGNLIEFTSKMRQPLDYPELKMPLLIIQGCATLFGMIVAPALYWKLSEKKRLADFFSNSPVSPLMLVLTGLIMVIFIIPNSVVIEWNAKVHFPEVLSGLEHWARQREDFGEELTRFITTFNSAGEFAVAFIVIAIFAGIGEELVFRGMIQPKLHEATKNHHAAIWISAFLFSALHLQFFGFVPRLFLGALFGYLYYWSGNMAVPIIAHFVNNAFMVIMLYLRQLGVISIDVESADAAPWPAVISGTILTFGLLVYVKKLFERNQVNS